MCIAASTGCTSEDGVATHLGCEWSVNDFENRSQTQFIHWADDNEDPSDPDQFMNFYDFASETLGESIRHLGEFKISNGLTIKYFVTNYDSTEYQTPIYQITRENHSGSVVLYNYLYTSTLIQCN
jgi:hypothetical protein